MPRPSKTNREETQAITRQRLLEAAIVEFAHKGFDEANINAISTAAGFAKGTIYNYFPSKQALMLALIAEVGTSHVQYICERVRQVPGPIQRLTRFYEAGFTFVEAYPPQARFLVTTLHSPEIGMQEAMNHAYQPLFSLVAEDILAPGINQGIFRPVGLQETATMLMTIYLGTGSQVDLQGKPFMDPHQVSDFVLHALASKTAI